MPDAEEKLQAPVDGADDRNDLIRIARAIDFWLARNPLDFGEPRFETVRLGVVRPPHGASSCRPMTKGRSAPEPFPPAIGAGAGAEPAREANLTVDSAG